MRFSSFKALVTYQSTYQFFQTTLRDDAIISISLCFSSSVICTYRFIVMPILECPSIVCNVFGFIPPSIHLVANVCRNTCMENLGIPILSHCLNSMVSYVLFLTGVPFLHRKTCSDHSITGIFHNHIILICIIKHIKQCYPCLINCRCTLSFVCHPVHNHLALNRFYL